MAAGASDHLLPTDTARVLSLRNVPPGNYFVRLLGIANVAAALGFLWCSQNLKRRKPVHYALTL